MGRNIISGESGPGSSGYVPNFSVPPQNHYQQIPPSPPHNQYLNHLANAAQFYESNGGGGTPPARVYSPLSHGSNSSTGSSSVLSFVSGSGNSSNNLTPMEGVNCVKYEFDHFPQEADGGPVKISTWKDHVAVFSIDQVGVMCDVLLQEGDIPRLVDLLSTVAKEFVGRSEKILRAQAHVAYHAAEEDPRKFPQVYKILETNSFSPQYHAGLQKLWFTAHYREAEITRGRNLGAVDKYRIRRKFPLPRAIWDGEETVYCFKEKSRNALRESFRIEKYPNLEEKKKLSKETGLTMTQVGNWFKNKRQREKEKEQGKQVQKRSRNPYNSPVGLAMTPDILGMMLSTSGGGINQPLSHHPPHHPLPLQPHITPMSPGDFESAIKKARFDETRLKSYMDDGVYSSQYHPNGAPGMSPGEDSPRQSDIEAHHSRQGLTASPHLHHSPSNIDHSPEPPEIEMYGRRSHPSAPPGLRCGPDMAYVHHHHQHPGYHHHLQGHHSASPLPGGYEGTHLVHNSAAALSHA